MVKLRCTNLLLTLQSFIKAMKGYFRKNEARLMFCVYVLVPLSVYIHMRGGQRTTSHATYIPHCIRLVCLDSKLQGSTCFCLPSLADLIFKYWLQDQTQVFTFAVHFNDCTISWPLDPIFSKQKVFWSLDLF